MTERITYTKLPSDRDYVDARWDVILDGEKIGTVFRDRTSRVEPYAGKMYGRSITSTVWQCDAPGYRHFMRSKTRMDAVIDLLMWRGMSMDEARTVVGKRALW